MKSWLRNHPLSVVVLATALALAWFFRFDFHSRASGGAFMLNRWTGTVYLVTTSSVREIADSARAPEAVAPATKQANVFEQFDAKPDAAPAAAAPSGTADSKGEAWTPVDHDPFINEKKKPDAKSTKRYVISDTPLDYDPFVDQKKPGAEKVPDWVAK